MLQVVGESVPDFSTSALLTWEDNIVIGLWTTIVVDGPPDQVHHLESPLIFYIVELGP